MKFLEMLDETELNTLVERIANTCNAGAGTITEKAVDAVFQRYGFNAPHSATSVSHNILTSNTEQKRHIDRAAALNILLERAIQASANARNQVTDFTLLNQLDIAIAAVKREFKL